MATNLLAIGVRTDPVFVHFVAQAQILGRAVAALDLAEMARTASWRLSAPPDPTDRVYIEAEEVGLPADAACFVRLIDPPIGSVARPEVWGAMMIALRCWLQAAPGMVVNRPLTHQHNGAKPWHEAWIRAQGLKVPESITTSDCKLLREFVGRGPSVVKLTSGVRAETTKIASDSIASSGRTSRPLHVQRHVAGVDVRAHVIGDRVVACRILSDSTDYRSSGHATVQATELPTALTERLVELTRLQGLMFAGWDFIEDWTSDYWCLEANPMPGYSWYDRRLGGTITSALLELLV